MLKYKMINYKMTPTLFNQCTVFLKTLYLKKDFYKYFFGIIIMISVFAMIIKTDNTTKILNEIKKNVAKLSAEIPRCDLKEIACVQKKIACLYNIDQYSRSKIIPILDNKRVAALIHKIDINNTKELKKILEIHSWVVISKFGKETDHQAWYIVQHADHDPYFQAGIAYCLEKLVPLKETDPKNFAYLYDRVGINFQNLGFKQRYGTQADIINKAIQLKPYEGTLREMNVKRKKMGLNTIEEYQKQLADVYLK